MTLVGCGELTPLKILVVKIKKNIGVDFVLGVNFIWRVNIL